MPPPSPAWAVHPALGCELRPDTQSRQCFYFPLYDNWCYLWDTRWRTTMSSWSGAGHWAVLGQSWGATASPGITSRVSLLAAAQRSSTRSLTGNKKRAIREHKRENYSENQSGCTAIQCSGADEKSPVRVEWSRLHTALRIMRASPANLPVQTPLLKVSQLPRTVWHIWWQCWARVT